VIELRFGTVQSVDAINGYLLDNAVRFPTEAGTFVCGPRPELLVIRPSPIKL